MSGRVIDQLYHLLKEVIDFVRDDADLEDACDELASRQECIEHIMKRIRMTKDRSIKIRRILDKWDMVICRLQTKETERFKDVLDIFMLDNELRLEQLQDKRIALMV